MPYGYRSIMFSIIDSVEGNYPEPMSADLLPFSMKYLDQVLPEAYEQVFKEGLNKRVGLHKSASMHKSLSDLIVHALDDKNMTLEELMTIPEQDNFTYSDGPNYASGSFVAAIYKAAGLFGGEKVNAMEFTVKDVYQLDFFQRAKTTRPDQCQEADPHLEHCQLIGQYRMELPGLGSIKPYDNMNEKCASKAPHYVRTPDKC